ncbi:hypothetical protein CIK65_12925 [Brevibacterium aurantiacum]|uniref:Uncharacterized protein n=1 Tax=Brevibacterium aurantiacum TaxID=273384 RepID=A0A2A3YRA1_BREAU|nr:hypothetical protein CIK65_12925 [Brevibacterium aurantiacum]
MVETTSANPELLKEQVSSLFLQPLEAQSIILNSGVRIFDTAEPFGIPRLVGSSEQGWVGVAFRREGPHRGL